MVKSWVDPRARDGPGDHRNLPEIGQLSESLVAHLGRREPPFARISRALIVS